MSLISSYCNSFLCRIPILVAKGGQRLLLCVLAREIAVMSIWSDVLSFEFAAHAIVVAVLSILILNFSRRAAKAFAAAVLLVICLCWMLELPYFSFPSVNTRRYRVPKFTTFTSSISSLSRRAAPSCGIAISTISFYAVIILVPSVVAVIVAQRWFSDEAVAVRVFQKNLPSVVFVSNRSISEQAKGRPLDEREVQEGTGSGFVWDNEGRIVTNFHVIESEPNHSERKVMVRFPNEPLCEAKVMGVDKQSDLAVLRILNPQGKKLKPAQVGASVNLRVGQKVYAIGNPFGLDHTLTTGVVSGLHRDLKLRKGVIIKDGIQTDASINRGSSGGPLLDRSGKLIGINTAFCSPNKAFAGVGFSISIDEAHGKINQIIEKGRVTRPYLGIKFAPDQYHKLGLSGLLVYHVDPNSPAKEAGILPNRVEDGNHEKTGDIITSFNGKKVNTGKDLYDILDKCEAGMTVMVELLREGEIRNLEVTLAKQPMINHDKATG